MTRFCTGCGAVLVESMPGGGRRRVLRPWGLRSAPLTESPAMPELAAARKAARKSARAAARAIASASGRRLDLVFAGGVATVAIVGMLVYPYAKADEATAVRVQPPPLVKVPTLASMREVRLAAPPLTDAVHGSLAKRRDTERQPNRVAARAPSARDERSLPIAPVTPGPVADASPPLKPEPPLARPAPEPVDRWQSVRDALAACAGQPGMLDRAVCEQGVRIASCESYWGHVPLCPSWRRDQAQ